MNLSQAFPYCLLLNVTRDVEKRVAATAQLEDHGIAFVRFPAIDPEWVREKHRDIDPGNYAGSLSLKLALRAASRKDAGAVMLVDDRIHINDLFDRHLAKLELPSDWGMFFFGCRHLEKPTMVQPGLVRVTAAISAPTVGINRTCFREISRKLDDARSPANSSIDQVLLALQKEIPTYAPFPNLVGFRDEPASPEPAHPAAPLQSISDPAVAGVMAESLGYTGPTRRQKIPSVSQLRPRPPGMVVSGKRLPSCFPAYGVTPTLEYGKNIGRHVPGLTACIRIRRTSHPCLRVGSRIPR